MYSIQSIYHLLSSSSCPVMFYDRIEEIHDKFTNIFGFPAVRSFGGFPSSDHMSDPSDVTNIQEEAQGIPIVGE